MLAKGYLLSKKERKTGTPERPLSALGALGYKTYWTLAIMRYLQMAPDNPRLEGLFKHAFPEHQLNVSHIYSDISSATSMTLEDIYVTLLQQDMIFVKESTPLSARPSPGHSIKFNRGRKANLSRRQSQRASPNAGEKPKNIEIPPIYEIHWDRAKVLEYLKGWERKGYYTLKPERLKWTPFVVFRPQTSKDLSTLASNPVVGSSGQNTDVRMVDEEPTDKGSATAESRAVTEVSTNTTPVPPATNGLDRLADAALLFSSMLPSTSPETTFQPAVDSPSKSERNGDGGPDTQPSKKDAEALQLAEDEALALQLANSPLISTRRLRHHSRTVSSNSRPTTPAISSTPAIDPKVPERTTRSRPSQSLPKQSPTRPAEDHVDADAALAEQLFREDERHRRRLRSASNTVHVSPNVPVPSSSTKVSARKKPRVVESPDEDLAPPAAVDSRPATRASARRLTALIADSDSLPPSPVRSTRSRNGTNGSPGQGHDLGFNMPPPSPLGLRTSSRLNALASTRISSSPIKPVPVKTRNSARDRNVDLHKMDAEEPEDIPKTHNIEEVEDSVEEEEDIYGNSADHRLKAGDNGEDLHLAENGIKSGVKTHHGDVDSDSPATTLTNGVFENGQQERQPHKPPQVNGFGMLGSTATIGDDDPDLDAEGEDEDAEGEPDMDYMPF